MPQTIRARVMIGSHLDATGLDRALQKPTQSGTETWLKRKQLTKLGRGAPIAELIHDLSSVEQPARQPDPVTLHYFHPPPHALPQPLRRPTFNPTPDPPTPRPPLTPAPPEPSRPR